MEDRLITLNKEQLKEFLDAMVDALFEKAPNDLTLKLDEKLFKDFGEELATEIVAAILARKLVQIKK